MLKRLLTHHVITRYMSDSNIRVTVNMLSAGIKNLSIRGLIRVELRPLIKDIPLFGAVSVSFVNQPVILIFHHFIFCFSVTLIFIMCLTTHNVNFHNLNGLPTQFALEFAIENLSCFEGFNKIFFCLFVVR